MSLCGNFTAVTEIELNENETAIHLTPPYETLSDEIAGQLYAYRLNRSAVILGTRDENVFGAAVGIGALASGRYSCSAENSKINRSVEVAIRVTSEICLKSSIFKELNLNY